MLIAPGFVPEGGGIDWSNVTASSLLGLEPGAAVVEGEVGLFLALKSFLVKRVVSCNERFQDKTANSRFSLNQMIGDP